VKDVVLRFHSRFCDYHSPDDFWAVVVTGVDVEGVNESYYW
jgi:hypothetical protein